jgi:hypothetical protein
MKKNYIVPETKNFKLQIGHLMTVSGISNSTVGEGSASSPVNLSRGGGDWDDED